eukprot:g18567.t1
MASYAAGPGATREFCGQHAGEGMFNVKMGRRGNSKRAHLAVGHDSAHAVGANVVRNETIEGSGFNLVEGSSSELLEDGGIRQEAPQRDGAPEAAVEVRSSQRQERI